MSTDKLPDYIVGSNEDYSNPWQTAQRMAHLGGHPDDSKAYMAGSALRGLVDNKFTSGVANTIGNTMDKGPVVGGLAGAGGLGLLGYGLGKLWDWKNDKEDGDGGTIGGALGAIGGGLLGAYSGYHRQANLPPKSASMAGGNSLAYIKQRMDQDNNLSQRESHSLLEALSGLHDSQLDRLADILKVSFGAAVGAIIARFLANAGIPGMAVGALAGGVLANGLSNPSLLGGSKHLGSTDAYGNPNFL